MESGIEPMGHDAETHPFSRRLFCHFPLSAESRSREEKRREKRSGQFGPVDTRERRKNFHTGSRTMEARD